ncbi:hypothetical protein [uncultured Halomonas sp.]|uniref:hypothetical protein n=1 Tax=uncultured Halomonas sp. TaxID=173971 RepID=UPI00260C36AC|nr:hypothetical protein [uncultured Halomonas sp.]
MDFQQEFAEMAERVTSGRVSDDAAKVLMLAQEHFNHKRDQLQTVLTYRDKPVRFCVNGDEDDEAPQFQPGTDLHNGFITGVEIALQFMGDFPIKIAERDD